MSACPKCGHRLRVLDLGQKCPKCGVNIRFYDFDKQFYHDAKKAELSLARVHVKFGILKSTLIGGKLQIARLACSLLPLLSMLLPVVNAKITLPFSDSDVSMSLFGIYNSVVNGSLGLMLLMTDSPADGEAFSAFLLCAGFFVFSMLLALATLLMSLLSFASIKKMSVALCCVSGLGVLSTIGSAITAVLFCKSEAASAGYMLTGSMSFGYIVTIIMFIVVFVLNLMIAKNGIHIDFAEGDLERVEIYKKIKNGELNFDDLPQPIVETAETRKIDEEIRAQQQLYKEKQAQKEAEEAAKKEAAASEKA